MSLLLFCVVVFIVALSSFVSPSVFGHACSRPCASGSHSPPFFFVFLAIAPFLLLQVLTEVRVVALGVSWF